MGTTEAGTTTPPPEPDGRPRSSRARRALASSRGLTSVPLETETVLLRRSVSAGQSRRSDALRARDEPLVRLLGTATQRREGGGVVQLGDLMAGVRALPGRPCHAVLGDGGRTAVGAPPGTGLLEL